MLLLSSLDEYRGNWAWMLFGVLSLNECFISCKILLGPIRIDEWDK